MNNYQNSSKFLRMVDSLLLMRFATETLEIEVQNDEELLSKEQIYQEIEEELGYCGFHLVLGDLKLGELKELAEELDLEGSRSKAVIVKRTMERAKEKGLPRFLKKLSKESQQIISNSMQNEFLDHKVLYDDIKSLGITNKLPFTKMDILKEFCYQCDIDTEGIHSGQRMAECLMEMKRVESPRVSKKKEKIENKTIVEPVKPSTKKASKEKKENVPVIESDSNEKHLTRFTIKQLTSFLDHHQVKYEKSGLKKKNYINLVLDFLKESQQGEEPEESESSEEEEPSQSHKPTTEEESQDNEQESEKKEEDSEQSESEEPEKVKEKTPTKLPQENQEESQTSKSENEEESESEDIYKIKKKNQSPTKLPSLKKTKKTIQSKESIALPAKFT